MEMKNNEQEKAIREKIKYFFEDKIFTHIKHKDSYFLNGYFIKEVRPDLWLFKERKLGEIFIHISEMRDINKYEEVGE